MLGYLPNTHWNCRSGFEKLQNIFNITEQVLFNVITTINAMTWEPLQTYYLPQVQESPPRDRLQCPHQLQTPNPVYYFLYHEKVIPPEHNKQNLANNCQLLSVLQACIQYITPLKAHLLNITQCTYCCHSMIWITSLYSTRYSNFCHMMTGRNLPTLSLQNPTTFSSWL